MKRGKTKRVYKYFIIKNKNKEYCPFDTIKARSYCRRKLNIVCDVVHVDKQITATGVI